MSGPHSTGASAQWYARELSFFGVSRHGLQESLASYSVTLSSLRRLALQRWVLPLLPPLFQVKSIFRAFLFEYFLQVSTLSL